MLVDVDYFSTQYSEEASQDIEECEKAEKLGAVNGSLRYNIFHVCVRNNHNSLLFDLVLQVLSLNVCPCSDETRQALQEWKKHDDESDRFCMLDGNQGF